MFVTSVGYSSLCFSGGRAGCLNTHTHWQSDTVMRFWVTEWGLCIGTLLRFWWDWKKIPRKKIILLTGSHAFKITVLFRYSIDHFRSRFWFCSSFSKSVPQTSSNPWFYYTLLGMSYFVSKYTSLWRQLFYINFLSRPVNKGTIRVIPATHASCCISDVPSFKISNRYFHLCHMKPLTCAEPFWQWCSPANVIMEQTFTHRLLPCAHCCIYNVTK
jgi:hypothetical protein